jgi:hypothetical protein
MSEPPEENESMTTVPSEPTTEAGRRVVSGRGVFSLSDILSIEAEAREGYVRLADDEVVIRTENVLAIEAEARADALDVEALARALQLSRPDVKEWVHMEEIADSVQAAEGAGTDAAHDTEDAAGWRRRAASERLAREYLAILAERQP